MQRMCQRLQSIDGLFLIFSGAHCHIIKPRFFYPGPAVGRGMGPPRVGQNFEAVAWFLNEQEQEGLCLCFF